MQDSFAEDWLAGRITDLSAEEAADTLAGMVLALKGLLAKRPAPERPAQKAKLPEHGYCEHGISHRGDRHGCDGCCKT